MRKLSRMGNFYVMHALVYNKKSLSPLVVLVINEPPLDTSVTILATAPQRCRKQCVQDGERSGKVVPYHGVAGEEYLRWHSLDSFHAVVVFTLCCAILLVSVINRSRG